MVSGVKLLVLYCGGGVADDGYVAAGFDDVVGVDIQRQPDYPYLFVQADALEFLARNGQHFDAIHASPPCQFVTRAQHLRTAQGGRSSSGDLLTPTLAALRERWDHVPWVVENVENARAMMPGAVRCCGSSFGLQVQRHRLFTSNVPLVGTACAHETFPLDPISGKPRPWGVYHVLNDQVPSGGRTVSTLEQGHEVMGVTRRYPWRTLKQGYPPAYAKHIGRQLIAACR